MTAYLIAITPTMVETVTFGDRQDVRQLVTRMVSNGLVVEDTDLSQIAAYLTNTFVDGR